MYDENEITHNVTTGPVENPSANRPTLLTLLCVLTFVASAYYVISGLFGLFVSGSFDNTQWEFISTQATDVLSDVDGNASKIMDNVMAAISETITNGIRFSFILGLVKVLVALLSGYGAFLMWMLQKRGFLIYAGAKIAGVAIPLFLLGFNIISAGTAAVSLFVGSIFIILYATTRKYMA